MSPEDGLRGALTAGERMGGNGDARAQHRNETRVRGHQEGIVAVVAAPPTAGPAQRNVARLSCK